METPQRTKRRRIKTAVDQALKRIRSPNIRRLVTRRTFSPSVIVKRKLNNNFCISRISNSIGSSTENSVNPNSVNDTVNCCTQDNLNINILDQNRKRVVQLKDWALTNNITQSALGDLLLLIRDWMPNCGFPKDPRTLVNTPAKVTLLSIAGGHMYYFGIRRHLIAAVRKGLVSIVLPNLPYLREKENVISITVGIDGLPISKSSTTQFWPILAYIDQSEQKQVFVVSLFCGDKKPQNVNEFLQSFIAEMKELEQGILIDDAVYYARIRCVVADAPARAFIKCIKTHNGYYGCERCFRKGKWIRKVTYPFKQPQQLYTDESFQQSQYEQHHEGHSPLTDLKIGMISQIGLDYMHLCCLGIMKKLLLLWTEIMPYKLRPKTVKKISKRIIELKDFIPNEFSRRPRSLDLLKHWKATEFRLFMLYIGPVVLQKYLDESRFKNFMLFHVGIYILANSEITNGGWHNYAGKLLNEFVKTFQDLYDKSNMVYNVHSVSHLHEDVKRLGPVDSFSAFKFESFMYILKKKLRANHSHLKQIVHRLLEEDCMLKSKTNYEVSINCSFVKNNCYLTKESKVCMLKRFNSDDSCVVQFYNNQNNVDWYPLESGKLGIWALENLECETTVKKSLLYKRCIRLPCKDNFICIPLCNATINM